MIRLSQTEFIDGLRIKCSILQELLCYNRGII